MRRGSITVFFSLVLVLILALILTMAESSRIQGLRTKARLHADLAEDSLLAEYSSPLWEEYGILLRNADSGSGELDIASLEEAMGKVEQIQMTDHDLVELLGPKSVDFYKLESWQYRITEYELATDRDGDVFRKAAVKAMKDEIPEDIVKGICKAAGKVESADTTVEDKIKDGKEALSGKKSDLPSGKSSVLGKKALPVIQPSLGDTTILGDTEPLSDTVLPGDTEPLSDTDPLSDVEVVDTGLLLTCLVDDASKLSNATIDRSGSLENRNISQGNMESDQAESNAIDKVMFDYYLKKHFSCYTSDVNEHETKYELEYLIAGKDSDKANLRSVARRLLVIREGFNFASLLQDTGKRETALTIATLLVGYFGIPQLVQAVQMGILAGWAYADSMEDVRKLLRGESVPLMEVSGQQEKTSDLAIDDTKDKDTAVSWNALKYSDYLQVLLFMTGDKKLNYRTMDLMEKSICKKEGYHNFSMDHMVSRIRGSASYEAPLIFDVFQYSGKQSWDLNVEVECGY